MVRIKSEIDISDRSRLVTFGERAQRSALELQKTVTDATNEMMRQASEMMKSQAIDIEKQSQREIIDIETLEKTNRDLLDTISGVLNVQQEGRESGPRSRGAWHSSPTNSRRGSSRQPHESPCAARATQSNSGASAYLAMLASSIGKPDLIEAGDLDKEPMHATRPCTAGRRRAVVGFERLARRSLSRTREDRRSLRRDVELI
jgi:hypothetical protein